MNSASFEEFVREFARLAAVAGTGTALGSARKVTLHAGVEAVADDSGVVRWVPVVSPATRHGPIGTPHSVTIEWEPGPVTGSTPKTPVRTKDSAPSTVEEAGGGDPATLRRRLELVLGGPPGFTTGAKAEILADLLVEFGRQPLLEAIRAEWITCFDTGIDSSPSVSKPN